MDFLEKLNERGFMRCLTLLSLLVIMSIFPVLCHANVIFNMSAQDNAMGYYSGAGNIWNVGPNECLVNPAKLGYLGEGVSWSLSTIQYYYDINPSSSYIAANWRGLGVMLPCYNSNGDMGKSVEGSYDSFKRESSFALGVNLLEFIATMKQNERLYNHSLHYDFSIGYQHTGYGGKTYNEYGEKFDFTGFEDGIGIIGRFTPTAAKEQQGELTAVDLTAAVCLVNPSQGALKLKDTAHSLEVAEGTYYAFAANFLHKDNNSFLPDLIRSKLGLTFSANMLQAYGENCFSFGLSAMILDIFSIRVGRSMSTYSYDSDDIFNWGFGVNLNYRDLVQFKYDWSENGAGESWAYDYNEFTLRVNFWKLLAKK